MIFIHIKIVDMSEKNKERLKKFLNVTFNLQFSTSKLLAYIIVGLGAWVSLELKMDSPFTIGVVASAALFGVKVWGDGKSPKAISDISKKNEDAI